VLVGTVSKPPSGDSPRPSDLLLDGLAVLVTEGRVQAAPLLRRAVRVLADRVPADLQPGGQGSNPLGFRGLSST